VFRCYSWNLDESIRRLEYMRRSQILGADKLA
jgi:hypothetical protein